MFISNTVLIAIKITVDLIFYSNKNFVVCMINKWAETSYLCCKPQWEKFFFGVQAISASASHWGSHNELQSAQWSGTGALHTPNRVPSCLSVKSEQLLQLNAPTEWALPHLALRRFTPYHLPPPRSPHPSSSLSPLHGNANSRWLKMQHTL